MLTRFEAAVLILASLGLVACLAYQDAYYHANHERLQAEALRVMLEAQ